MNTITLPRSVVEKALEALKYERDANNPLDWHHDKTMTALCTALEQPQVNSPEIPEGWKLVPVKPTEDMLNAVAWPGCAATDWEHMLAAAPQPPVVKESLTADPDQSDSTASAYQRGYLDGMAKGRRDAAMDAEEDQQPVAWLFRDANNHKIWFLEKTSTPTGYRGEWIKTPLYARPQPKREPLTMEEPQVEQEPVAFLTRDEEGDPSMLFFDRREAESYCDDGEKPTPLYTYPQPKREPLTDEQIRAMWCQFAPVIGGPLDFARAIEAAHGIGGEA